MSFLVALDPGKHKCGLILANIEENTVSQGYVVLNSKVNDLINTWKHSFHIDRIIIGNGSTSEYWQKNLIHISPIIIINEKGSTFLARYRYWEIWPPSKWISWLPKGLILPPDNLDSVAALILLEKHLGYKLRWNSFNKFKTLL